MEGRIAQGICRCPDGAKGDGLISASVVNDTTSTQVLLIEGKLTGSANRLTFLDKAVDLGVKAGHAPALRRRLPGGGAGPEGHRRHGRPRSPRTACRCRTARSSSIPARS